MSCKKNGEPSLGYTLEHAPPVSPAWDRIFRQTQQLELNLAEEPE